MRFSQSRFCKTLKAGDLPIEWQPLGSRRLPLTSLKNGLIPLALILLTSIYLPRLVMAQETAAAEPGVFRSETLEMGVKAGFGRLEVNGWAGTWVPVRVTLVNQGENISGKLVIRAESSQGPSPRHREFVKEINLPTGSRQFHEIAAFLNTGPEIEIQLRSDEQVVASTKLAVNRNYTGDQLEILVVDTEATALNDISALEIVKPVTRQPFGRRLQSAPAQESTPSVGSGASGASTSRRLRRGPWYQQPPAAHPTAIPAEDLPRDFVSYDSIDSVVIGDAPLNQLTAEQVRALKLWVASGGLLIVTGGADVAGLKATGLDSISPVDLHEAITVTALTELTEAYSPFELNDALLVRSATLRPGAATLVGEDQRALVAERYYGDGLVRFVAINPKLNPYRGWGASKELWTDLLLPATEFRPRSGNWFTIVNLPSMGQVGRSGSSRWGIQTFLFDLAEIKPTSPKYFLIFLLLYILTVGPINYVLLRWMRKTDLAWVTIPGVVILFTVVSVAVAQLSRGGEAVAADVSLVEVHQRDGITQVSSGLLIMPTSKGIHRLLFDGGDTYASDMAEGSQASSASLDGIESERTSGQFTMQVPMNTWTAGIFQVRSTSDNNEQFVSLFVRNDVETPEGTEATASSSVVVKNQSQSPISNAMYISREGVSDLFNLAAGEERKIALTPARSGALAAWYKSQLTSGSSEATVFTDLEPLLDREIGGEPAFRQAFFNRPSMLDALQSLERPLVLGFVEQSPTSIGFNKPLRRRSKAFYVIHL